MEESVKPRKKRGFTRENARIYRQRGHNDSLEFALAIGLTKDYRNDLQAKKDVIDPSGDSHSVKSGDKKWQIFLYGLSRFETDTAFLAMNGIGRILINCINSFPKTFEEYQTSKNSGKQRLRKSMIHLKNKLRENYRLHAFLNCARSIHISPFINDSLFFKIISKMRNTPELVFYRLNSCAVFGGCICI